MGAGSVSKELTQPLKVTRNGRRYFSRSHKQRVVQACLAPGASVAAVALSFGFNANLVRRWIRQHQAQARSNKAQLVPITVTDACAVSVDTPGSNAKRSRDGVQPLIEIEYAGAQIVVNGEIEGCLLRDLLDTLARHR